jgi:uncharacterized protein YacL
MNLRQLSNYKNLSNVPHILFGTLVVDLVTILIVKNSNVLGTVLKDWYDQFGLSAVLADVLIIVLGILMAQYIYTEFFPSYSPIFFLLLVVLIQLVHDVLFHVGVIQMVPQGQNRIIDIFKRYADENSWKIIVGDAILMLGSTAVAAASLQLSPPLFVFLGILTIYAIPYAIA